MRWLCSLIPAFAVVVAAACCSTSSDSGGTAPAGGGEGAAPAGKNYELVVTAPETSKVGQESKAVIVVTPRNGYKINQEYPAKLLFESSPAGVKVEARISRKSMSVEEKRLTIPVPFTPEGPGAKTFEGELRFSVCDKQSCQMPRERVTFSTVAEGTAPAAPTGDGGPPAEAGGDGGTAPETADGGTVGR